jgi:acyl carrier protein
MITRLQEEFETMDRATVLEQLTEVAVEVLGVDPKVVSETSSFKDDLDADSLDLVEVVMALEERFDISVPEEKLDGITTVGEAVDLVIGIAAAGPNGSTVPA